ncbi:MAG: DUF2062 domain-containing protein [Gammaproteobacteria bacterium]|nr:DUF2062 domain-containing protein [Gammaproteobacteria bacterium]
MIMPRKIFRKFLPHPDVITDSRWIKLLGPRLQEPSLWHINRRSCSLAVALGVFCAFIPVPFQMLIAAVGAILFRVNILVAVPLVWISNPLTMGPMYFFCYLIGVEILDIELTGFHFELSFNWLLNGLAAIWQPFLLGCLVFGVISSLVSFLLVRVLWHLHILRHIKARAARHHNRRPGKYPQP